MTLRIALAVVILGATATAPALAQNRLVTSAAPVSASVIESVHPTYRDAVTRVVKSPSVSTTYAEESFPASTAVYTWMLAHPDRVSLAWQRLQVPCVEISDLGQGKFFWTDETGSELTWQQVGTLNDGLVWYATGKVKAATLLPMLPVRAVVVLRYPANTNGHIKPEISAYIHSDSRAVHALMRVMGPAAPKMAEQGAEQLLYFFSGIARYLHKHPTHVQAVLGPKAK